LLSAVLRVGRALAVLASGFALADTALGQSLGDAVAAGLASLAAPLIRLFDATVLQTGTELRSLKGWAVRVSEVCDGHGLAISLAAGLAALAPGAKSGLLRLFVGLVAIQAFNLIRIVVLAMSLAKAPHTFDTIHTVVFPFLTVALMALCVLPLRDAVRLSALSLPLVLLWLPVADVLSQALVLPANLILSLTGGPETGQIAQRAAGWTVGTGLLAGEANGQVTRFLAPLRPADFALAAPLLLAAVALSQRPLWLAMAALSLVAAVVAAAYTSIWGLATAQPSATVLVPDGAGAFLARDFTPPATALALARLAQNVLVHLNLLVLPFLILTEGRKGV
jgi:exosortase/archaeosortase family protein